MITVQGFELVIENQMERNLVNNMESGTTLPQTNMETHIVPI